ncbi:MAG: ABC transporter ATP-binding protein [Pirellulales bacterium]
MPGPPLDSPADAWNVLPAALRARIEGQLAADETVVAWFEPNLDSDLRFARGLVVLSSQHLFSIGPPSECAADDVPEQPAEQELERFSLPPEAALQLSDRAGIGTLELTGPNGRIACWRYTVDRAPAVRRLVERLDDLRAGQRLDLNDDIGEPLDEVEAPPRAGALLRLVGFARNRSGLIFLGLLLTFATTAAGLVPPYLTMPLLDDVLIPHQNEVEAIKQRPDLDAAAKSEELFKLRQDSGNRLRLVLLYLSGLLAAAVAAWLLGWAQGVVMAWVSERISADLRNRTYGHLQQLSLEYFGGKRTGDLIARISTDTDRICSFISDSVVDFSTDCLMIIGTAVILAVIDWRLAIACVVPFPVIGWMVYYMRGRLTTGFRRGGRAWSEMTSVLADTIPGMRVVKAFAQERREIGRFGRANDRVVEANDRVNTVWAFFWPMVVFLNQLGLLVIWAFGAWQVFNTQITVGVLSAFLAYIGRFYTRLESMSRMFSVTQRAAASAQRIFEILDRDPTVPEPANPIPTGEIKGRIELCDVAFRYGNRLVVDGFNLTIEPGEMIGLVGSSGAGKSTLVNLVCRFYDVSSGSVMVDGHDVRQYGIADYRRHIGIVLQDPFLFFGTIAENICYGRPEATRQEVIDAARAARAHEFILRLPDGYDSLVGERGQMLSGGERQRISIARALLIDPSILILDEATSSVDTETERDIQAALDNLIRGRTTIAVAHRLSTLRKADRLIVMSRGRIAEEGRHDELLERQGMYARLHRAQIELAHGAD